MSVRKVSCFLLLIAFCLGQISFYGLARSYNMYYLFSIITANTAIIIILYNILSSSKYQNQTNAKTDYYIYVNIYPDFPGQSFFEVPLKRRNL